MKEKKTKTFIVDGKAYKFNHSKFKEAYMFQLGQSRKGQKYSPRHDKNNQAKTEQSFREEMATEICTSPDAIKKWRYGINSPGSVEIISDIEKYLQMEKGSLLLEDVSDKVIEIKKEKVNMTNRIIPDYERNAVRNVYQKLVECINAFESTGGELDFYSDECMEPEEYVSIMSSVEPTFRKYMMDIPENIYNGLFRIFKLVYSGSDDDDYYISDFTGDIWFEEYLKEYCEDYGKLNDYSNYYVQVKNVHKLVDGWFQEVRVILKDYIPA